jgi:hypothetical protein
MVAERLEQVCRNGTYDQEWTVSKKYAPTPLSREGELSPDAVEENFV